MRRGLLRAEAGARYEHQSRRRRRRRDHRQSRRSAAASTPFPARSAPAYGPRAPALRHQPVAHRARAERRGAVRQRPPSRHPGLRDRRSRPRQGEEQRRRADAAGLAATATASAPPPITSGSATIFTSRRPARSRTICRSSNISRPTPAIAASRSKARSASRRIGGVTLNARRARRLCPRDDRSRPARRRASRRSGCSAGSRRSRTGSTAASRSSGSPTRTGSPRSRRRPTAIRWSTPRSPSIRSARQQQQHRPFGQQHLRRRRAAPCELPQGFRAARRPRPQDQRPLHLLTSDRPVVGIMVNTLWIRSAASATRSSSAVAIKLTETLCRL